MVLFLRNKRFSFMLFWADYYLRWWRLPIEERACRKTDLGGGDYYLRNSGLHSILMVALLKIIIISYFKMFAVFFQFKLAHFQI